MPRIPKETREEIIRLYNNGDGLPPAEIGRQTGIPYSSVYGLTIARQRINPETGEKFESLKQYQEYTAMQNVNPDTGEFFESLSQYQKYAARQRINPETGEPFKSRSQYLECKAKQTTNPETGEPFKSRSQYQEYLARQRAKRPKNKALSNLIKKRLNDLGKNQSWLAIKMETAIPTVSRYIRGRSIPSDLPRLFSSLEVPYKTLDDLLD